jgi:hypothetical protein
MTKTANEGFILTRIDKQEKDHSDWSTSVTSTEEGVSLWEEVPIEDYLLWLKDHPIDTQEEYADNTGEVYE